MSGTIFDKSSGTFADELGVENIYDEDMPAEEQDEAVEDAALELNPPLSKPKEWDLVSPLASAENAGLIKAYTELDARVTAMGRKLYEVSQMLEDLYSSINSGDDFLEDEAEESLEPEDLDSYQPQKKGSPGRPAKQPPKIAVPKKQKAKPAAKKPAKAKPKAKAKAKAKAKPKSRKR